MAASESATSAEFSLVGFVLGIIGGVVAAAGLGYAYYYVANEIGLDIVIVMALALGFGVGWVTGMAARLGRLRTTLLLILLGLIFGVAAYAARYWFEYTALAGAAGPAGFVAYLQTIADEGMTLIDQGSSSTSTMQGTLVWVTFGVEAFFAAVTSVMATVTTARQQPLFGGR